VSELRATYRRKLHERAFERYGYFTTKDAAELAVPLIALGMVLRRGGLTHISYGLYRFDDVPVTGREAYMEAVLRVGEDAFLMADAVLALHDLALVNPTRLRVGTSRRSRPRVPRTIQIVRTDISPQDLTVYESIPSTTVARALTDSLGIVMTERLVAAANEAAERGLLRRGEVAGVLEQLEKK
jgi:predicted transcriptional regulator of viral defense system